ncbi:pleckstrin homology domain-containing [Phytophthora cinnamomi]|uniref:pleckstrin homology domain-containing n=1 Tax=Phytophthora cinnamomi TaxID=4785 RepID=UPI003559FA69|nr:pleckstrin homology domain-containing [Phytophthora cinnamomi]
MEGDYSHCDLSEPDFEGELTKRSGEPAHGLIDLADCLTVKSAEEKTNKRFCFEVATPDSTFYMYAENEKQKDEWIGAIGRAIVKFSSSFTGDQDDDAN